MVFSRSAADVTRQDLPDQRYPFPPSTSSSSSSDADESSSSSSSASTAPASLASLASSYQLPTVPDACVLETVDEADMATPDKWVKRDPRMVRLTGKHPFNSEARIEVLYAAGFLTPSSLFFVRNHGAVPRVDVDRASAWRVRVHGLYELNGGEELSLSIADLKRLFPVVTLPITLVCAGNRRKEQNVVHRSLGFDWGPAGVSTALFTGVYLADLIAYLRPIRRRAKHVVFEGADDDLPNGPYGTSRRLSWAASRDKGVLIAWKMNGLDLEPDHGFPVRVMVPGQVGGRSVKWLRRIEISEQESQHYLHFRDNKVLPTQLTAQQARDEAHWWYDPKYIIGDLNVNSAIAQPYHDETLDTPTNELIGRTYTVKGYAYAGGGRRVARVEISLDEGTKWELAEVAYPEDLYRAVTIEDDEVYGTLDLTKRDTCFCWCFWSFNVPVDRLANSNAIFVRGMDESLALQQRDMYWNPTGMMNNWWFRVAIHRSEEGRNTRLRFEHPTLAGVASGGWLERMKNEGKDILQPKFGTSPSTNGSDNPPPVAKPAVVMTNSDVKRTITFSEYKEASSGEGKKPFFIVNGECYDGQGFLDEHPGGADSIWLASGDPDSTEDFMAIHSDDAKRKLAQFHIGTMDKASATPAEEEDIADSSGTFLHKRKWKKATLESITPASHDSFVYRFKLTTPDVPLGLPCGQHVFVRLKHKKTGEVVQRAYTPVPPEDATGYIDLLVKLYLPTKEFPEGGKMSTAFSMLEVGDVVEFKGPFGSFIWEGNGNIRWRDVPRANVRKLGLVCGGSGITPILQVLRSIVRDEQDTETKVWLLNANKTEQDILCKEELDAAHERWGHLDAHSEDERRSNAKVRMHHALSTHPGAHWKFSTGRIDDEIMRTHLPPPGEDAMILVSGPDPMIKLTIKPGLQRLGWNLDTSLVVF